MELNIERIALRARLRVQRDALVERVLRQCNVLLNSGLPVQIDEDLVKDINYMTEWCGTFAAPDGEVIDLTEDDAMEIAEVVAEAEVEADAIDEECCICVSALEDPMYVCENGHRYHLECIHGMIEANRAQNEYMQHRANLCPQCRVPIPDAVVNEYLAGRAQHVVVDEQGNEHDNDQLRRANIMEGTQLLNQMYEDPFRFSLVDEFFGDRGRFSDDLRYGLYENLEHFVGIARQLGYNARDFSMFMRRIGGEYNETETLEVSMYLMFVIGIQALFKWIHGEFPQGVRFRLFLTQFLRLLWNDASGNRVEMEEQVVDLMGDIGLAMEMYVNGLRRNS